MSHILPPKKKSPLSMQNIKVCVRVRPLNKEECEKNHRSVVKCASSKEVHTKEKKYQFDRVFPPDSTQVDVYFYVISPMISDVLAGYNCTVFAYGQTGTGKTHTMIGGDPSPDVNWRNDALAGCIPRAAANIFDEITLMDTINYNVRVSFLELYNEEVRDLLSDDEKHSTLNIYNDHKNCVYIQGLNEVTVFNANDIYALLQKGTTKRQTASTLMNNHSSRSHTVFTISVHTRESTDNGEEVLKTGKINLVDLAGSENIAKSGAKDKRAVELANINRSLLTLGRVIHVLADKNTKHVPYRDSKLTRILQDSLGGHTKTCIIATVSPSHTSYEETCSTLEYACRARDIKNTPTVNEKVTKAQLLQEMNHEIERLKKDLDAARAGNGFFVDRDNWEKMQEEKQSLSCTLTLKNEMMEDLKNKLASMELLRETKAKEFDQIITECDRKEKQLSKAKFLLKQQKQRLKTEEYVANCYAATASENATKLVELVEVAKKLSGNQSILQDKLERQYLNNYCNEQIIKDNTANLSNTLSTAQSKVDRLQNVCQNVVGTIKDDLSDLKSTTSNLCAAYAQIYRTNKDYSCQADRSLGMLKRHLQQEKLSKIEQSRHLHEVQERLQEVRLNLDREVDDIDSILRQIGDLERDSAVRAENIREVENIELRQSIEAHKLYIKELEERLSNTQNSIEQNRPIPRVSLEHIDNYQESHIMNKIESIGTHSSSLEKEVDASTEEFNVLLMQSSDTVHTGILEKIIPVQRAGDTPKPQIVVFPKRVGAPPRDALIKKFKDECSEDIENESFQLNISMENLDDTMPSD